MSWKKFSSNNSRKGVMKIIQNKKIQYMLQSIYRRFIVNNQIDVGIIDISNLNYTKNTYKSVINILEFMPELIFQ